MQPGNRTSRTPELPSLIGSPMIHRAQPCDYAWPIQPRRSVSSVAALWRSLPRQGPPTPIELIRGERLQRGWNSCSIPASYGEPPSHLQGFSMPVRMRPSRSGKERRRTATFDSFPEDCGPYTSVNRHASTCMLQRRHAHDHRRAPTIGHHLPQGGFGGNTTAPITQQTARRPLSSARGPGSSPLHPRLHPLLSLVLLITPLPADITLSPESPSTTPKATASVPSHAARSAGAPHHGRKQQAHADRGG